MTTDPYILNHEPVNDLTPFNNPTKWNIPAGTLDTVIPTALAQTSNVSRLRMGRLMGDLMDRYGVSPTKGEDWQTEVLDAILAENTTGNAANEQSPAGGGVADMQDRISQPSLIAQALGALKLNPKLKGDDAWAAIAQKLGVSGVVPSQTKVTAADSVANIAMQFRGLDRTQIQSLQAQLYEGGFYTNPKVYQTGGNKLITPGSLDPNTMQAIGALLDQTAQANAAGTPATWVHVLGNAVGQNQEASAKAGSPLPDPNDPNSLSILLGATASTSSIPTVKLATADQLMSPVQQQFEARLGRMPTAQEEAQFTQQYDTAQEAGSKALNPQDIALLPTDFTDTGVALVPGVARPAWAAQEFAQSDQTEYVGHQIANAGALMMNSMRGVGLGASPNQTAAG